MSAQKEPLCSSKSLPETKKEKGKLGIYVTSILAVLFLAGAITCVLLTPLRDKLEDKILYSGLFFSAAIFMICFVCSAWEKYPRLSKILEKMKQEDSKFIVYGTLILTALFLAGGIATVLRPTSNHTVNIVLIVACFCFAAIYIGRFTYAAVKRFRETNPSCSIKLEPKYERSPSEDTDISLENQIEHNIKINFLDESLNHDGVLKSNPNQSYDQNIYNNCCSARKNIESDDEESLADDSDRSPQCTGTTAAGCT